MEYMMTYGWAILAIMVVGVALWQLGVFNLGSGMSATYSGFGIMKPLLPTCKIGPKAMYGSIDAFFCQFINNAGSEILITDVNITVNGNTCWVQRIANTPESGSGGPLRAYIYRQCTSNGVCPIHSCYNYPGATACLSGNGPLRILKDAQFTVYNYDMDYNNICQLPVVGDRFTVNVDITYNLDVGGAVSEHHELGTINLMAT
jgi:hypothetical protein